MKRNLIALVAIATALIALAIACSKDSGSPTAVEANPVCSIAPSTIAFGSVVVNATLDRQVTVTNAGGGTLTGALTESCTGFQIVGSSTYSLGPGQSKTLAVRFWPPEERAYACTLSTSPAGCLVVCTGTGVAAPNPCTISPASLDFGQVTVGQSQDRSFTLTNQGSTTMAGSISESCPEFSIVGSASYSLGAGESATFTIRFSPAQAGPQNCTVQTGVPGCPTVPCMGTGITSNPACQVSVGGFSFPQVAVGDRADATFEITNVGTSNLIGTVTEGCPDYSIPGSASYNLAPGQSQTFIVRFEPTVVGEQTCEVSVGAGCPPLSCWGSGVIGCTFTPEFVDFGYIRKGDIRCGSLTLKNNTSTLQQGLLYATPEGPHGYAGDIQLEGQVVSGTEGLAYALNAGQMRTFTLCWTTQFVTTPCDSVIGQWKIVSTDRGCVNWSPTVRGIITRGCACDVYPTTLDFGSVVVGDPSFPQDIFVTNESGIDGLKGKVRVLEGDFVLDKSEYICSSPGACVSCGFSPRLVPVGVRFRPTKLGPQTGRIVVENLGGCMGPGASVVCDTVRVSGVGVTAVGRD